MPKPRILGTSEVTELVRRARWTASEARRVLSARPPGLSLRAYAAELGQDVGRLYWWRARLARTEPAEACLEPRFLPVAVRAPEAGGGSEAEVIDVWLPRGLHVRIGRQVPVETAVRILTFLEGRSC